MAIQEGPDRHGEKAIRKNWPVVEGLTAGTTKQTGARFLEIENGSDATHRPKAYR